MSHVLRPGGRIVVLGVWTDHNTRVDRMWNRAGALANRIYRQLWGEDVMTAPATEPTMSLAEVRVMAGQLLPGVQIRRYPLWRYTMVWTKPTVQRF